ncbi:MAG: tRNA-dependent lipid II--amino acid ligase [Anaerolineae bacterium]|jgi:lipid II:glycine glycyltransferase (peptidoglycan interpeptide bridge formation enzyme)|nr:MAG: tRNA-dependent lipid II--amino acid ligase [Anaerolineae bacterium]
MYHKDYAQWDDFLAQFPNVHLLQSSAWGKVKEQFGWEVYHLFDQGWGAQVLVKNVLGGFRFGYIPKGPVGFESQIEQWLSRKNADGFSQSIRTQLKAFCSERGVAFIKIEPDVLLGGQVNSQDCPQGFQLGSHAIQPLRTILVDISSDETQILSRMKQKTRYNIRLAERKGVQVEQSNDIDLFYQMMLITGKRDGFGIHARDYYKHVYCLFEEQGQAKLFIAVFQGRPIAGLMAFMHGNRAFYLYGASLDDHREVMAPYLLHWKAIQWARERECTVYDLWGVPDYDETVLETHFGQRTGGLWGVYRFKRGFGGQVVRYAGPYDFVVSPLIYELYKIYTRRAGFRS